MRDSRLSPSRPLLGCQAKSCWCQRQPSAGSPSLRRAAPGKARGAISGAVHRAGCAVRRRGLAVSGDFAAPQVGPAGSKLLIKLLKRPIRAPRRTALEKSASRPAAADAEPRIEQHNRESLNNRAQVSPSLRSEQQPMQGFHSQEGCSAVLQPSRSLATLSVSPPAIVQRSRFGGAGPLLAPVGAASTVSAFPAGSAPSRTRSSSPRST